MNRRSAVSLSGGSLLFDQCIQLLAQQAQDPNANFAGTATGLVKQQMNR